MLNYERLYNVWFSGNTFSYQFFSFDLLKFIKDIAYSFCFYFHRKYLYITISLNVSLSIYEKNVNGTRKYLTQEP